MSQHSISQSEYQVKYKDLLKRQLDIMGHSTNEDELDVMLESGNVSVFTEGLLMETENQKQLLAELECRHGLILELEKSIRELHDLFIDVALLVDQQGEKIDTIELNVRKASYHVSTGKKELVQAEVSRRKFTKKKLICAIVTIILIVLLIASVAISMLY
jgi:t-SNARE complex subunit (syntaxin)